MRLAIPLDFIFRSYPDWRVIFAVLDHVCTLDE